MNPVEAAARFAAFAWYTETKPPGRFTQEQALRFACESWEAFLPVAHGGLGRLILRLASQEWRKARKRPAAAYQRA